MNCFLVLELWTIFVSLLLIKNSKSISNVLKKTTLRNFTRNIGEKD